MIMHISKRLKLRNAWIKLLLLPTLLQNVCGQIGIVYSPFVRNEDYSNSAAYTRNDVKVMLKLVQEGGYPVICTYGVGTLGGTYVHRETWKNCSSVVHTALAAAEINKEKRSQVVTVYQGLYVDEGTIASEPNTEIEVGFEVAMMANEMFAGTVAGLILPSVGGVDTVLNQNVINTMEKISTRSRSQNNMTFGTRVYDCIKFAEYMHNPKVKRLIGFTDFVICSMLPRPGDFAKGPEAFLNYTLDIVSTVIKTFQQIDPNSKTQVMLETGWPGGENLGQPNTDVSDLLQFWNLTKAYRGALPVFMFEAFDIPWKKSFPFDSSPLARYYGRWEHKQVRNDNSRNAYKLKSPVIQNQSTIGGLSKELIIGLVFGSVLFILLAIMIVFVYRRMSKIMRDNKLSEEEIRQFLDGITTTEGVDETDGSENWKRIPYNKDYELAKDKFIINKNHLLGSGQFGLVFKGKIDGLSNEVAFKLTRSDCPLSALRGLLSEIKILIYLGKHNHLVSLCGAYTAELTEGNVYLAIELCMNGSLEKYLRSSTRTDYVNNDTTSVPRYVSSPSGKPMEITDFQLLNWSLDIASAMEYIGSKNVIHADLATRNVLLTQNLTAKVTDFGLSRRLYEYTEYVKKHQEPLPWRWMAIESLRALQFSMQSDVWSYGITMWEIYSIGAIPYPGLTWNIDFVSQLENGLRMQKPARATPFLYDIMIKCWHTDPQSRPTFNMIKEALMSIRNIISIK